LSLRWENDFLKIYLVFYFNTEDVLKWWWYGVHYSIYAVLWQYRRQHSYVAY